MQIVRRRKAVVWWVIGGIAVLGVALALWWVSTHPAAEQSSTQTATDTVPPPPVPKQLQSMMLFTGNVYWGRYINDWSRASDLGTAYPFSRLSEFDRKKYQAWIGGLECPTVAGFTQTSAEEDTTLSFNCSPDYLPEAARWFDVFTLANNHTDNRGPDGLTETRQQLDKHGIQYFGDPDPRTLDNLCEVVSVDTVISYENNTTGKAQLPIALCGYHGVFRIPSQESLALMEQYSAYMPVIAMPHTGAEYTPGPDSIKSTLYRSMIDHGADAVLGDHPHWVQSTEAYKGKLIVYSMGNFMFDQQDSTEVTRSAAIQLRLTATGSSSDISAWTELAEQCRTHKDSCLTAAKEKGLSKLDYQFAFGTVGTRNNNRLTHPASAADQQSILKRLRWEQTMSGLKAPYGRI